MKITIYQNREVYKEESKIGNDSENKVETLEFEFPEEYRDFTKYIEFQIKGEKYTDIIENNKYEITRAIAKQGKIKTQVVLRKSIENDVLVFKSNVFELNVSKSINATENIPDEYPTWADNLTTLKQNLEKSEQERVTSEEARIEAETQREETFTQMEQSVEDAVKEIADKKADYNQNALEKTNEYNELTEQKTNAFNSNTEIKTNNFNQNYTEKTTVFDTDVTTKMNEFNTNATNKTTEFNNNAKSKTDTFNSNVETKTNEYNANANDKIAEYNRNHTAKMKEFDDNYDTKTKTFDDNAADKQNEFDENASDKLAEYNQNAKELINKVEQVQVENETLKAENKLIKEQIPGANASGNSIHVEDSGTLDFDWKIKGGHKQETREGYNKIDLSSISTEVTGIKASYDNETGDITFNGTSTQHYPNFFNKDINEMLVNGETWNVWQERASSDTNHEIYLQVTAVSKTGGANRYYTSATKEKRTSFVIDKEQYTYNLVLLGGTIANIGTLTNYKNRYMLYKGTDDKEYEQYGASPSPDYPSEIETVGSDVNYFNCRDTYTLRGITLTKYIDGSFKVEGTATENFNFNISNYFKLKGTHAFKYEVLEGNSPSVWFWNSTDSNSNLTFSKTNNSTVATFEDEKELALNFEAVKETTYSFTARMKIVKGKETGLYSPYGMGSVEIDVVNKNFLNISNKLDGTSIGVTTTTNNNGSIHISGTTMRAGPLFEKGRVKVGYLKAGTYSFSAKLIGSSQTTGANSCLYFRPASNGKEYAAMNPYANGTVFNNRVTLASDTEVFIEWYCNKSGVSIDADLYVQIERATANTETEQHQSQTAIMPVQQKMLEGDYISDVEHHEWQKFIFDGVTNRLNQKTGTSANNLYYTSYISNLLAPTSNGVKIEICSNCFKSYTANQLYGQDLVGVAVTTGKSFSIGFGLESSIDTLDKANEKLKELYDAGTPIIIYYKLAEAIDLELTSEQKAVRDTKLYTYKNITNIDVSDELASIDVEYKKDPTTEHDELQNQIDEIKQLISTTETSALLLDNLQKDVEMEVE